MIFLVICRCFLCYKVLSSGSCCGCCFCLVFLVLVNCHAVVVVVIDVPDFSS